MNQESTWDFGLWPSPLSAELAASGSTRFAGLALSESRDGSPLLWWSATEDGANRVQVCRVPGGSTVSSQDPAPQSLKGCRLEAIVSARSRVNEYGGGAFWVHGESVFWVEDSDQRIRRLDLSGDDGCLLDDSSGVAGADGGLSLDATGPGVALSPVGPFPRSLRYAAGVVEPGGAWMVTERESHCDSAGTPLDEPVNDLAWLPTGLAEGHPSCSLPDGVHQLVGGADFSAAPALSPDGRYLAWLQWDHPNMPWDSTELFVGEIDVSGEGPAMRAVRRVAGSQDTVSVCLPAWDRRGRLWWCDDREDLWLLCCAEQAGLPSPDAGGVVVAHTAGEVGAPRWVSGGARYGFGRRAVVAAESVGGLDRLAVLPNPDPALLHGADVDGADIDGADLDGAEAENHEVREVGIGSEGETGSAVSVGWPLSPGWIDSVAVAAAPGGDLVTALAGSPDTPTGVVLSREGFTRTLGATAWPLPSGSISTPLPISFPTGPTGEASAHGLFYPPKLDGVRGPSGELPPLVVRIHGGPTAAARAELSASVQFWTTRGFAVVDVNYRGSSGYGRVYRELLRGGWGEVEVQDCIAAADHLVATGRVDGSRCVIRGGSAGGFTALEAVSAPPTASGFHFAAATTLYGVTDLMALADDTHKFESRYLDGLIGPLPEAEQLYRQRSPLNHPERIAAPVLVLQGLEDPVVPPSQAEVLVAALGASGVDHEYRTYAGEGHGFRRKETIIDALEAELAFYRRVLQLG